MAPGRLLNVGIAEQALVGMAAGLAYAGKVPFAYSIAPFVTSRPNDQIRVDVAMAGANVKLVGVGGGVAYGYLGPTHHAIEDLALMRSLPGMTVLAPGDPGEALRATRAAFALDGPVYLRLGKNGEPPLLPPDVPFAVGRALSLRQGHEVTLATTGAMLAHTLDAAGRLAAAGIEAAVLHYGTVKPFDDYALRRQRGAHGRARHRRGALDRRRARQRRSRDAGRGRRAGAAAPRSACATSSRTRSARRSTCCATTA